MDEPFVIFVLVGFFAQMIDGCLGMAYGVSGTSFLLSAGLPPALASASVHTAEVVTTAVSGLSHLGFGNVDRKLFRSLLIPGVLGGVLGAALLSIVPTNQIIPWVSLYLVLMGMRIVGKAMRPIQRKERRTRVVFLGLVGGFCDSVGGGGWGPIVTTTLVAGGDQPRFAIGSVNAAEFFVSIAQAGTFLSLLGLVYWRVVLGLILGGVIAAPLAAYLARRLPARLLMVIVGIVVAALGLRMFLISIG